MNHSSKDIEEVDDDLFISRKPQNYIFAEKKANDLNERTNKMMTNARQIVQETQQIGQSALENLSVQRESLERVENDLDSINTMTRSTQKHLTNMKSFWGGLKSLFSSDTNSTTAAAPVPNTVNPSMPRSKTLASVPSNIPASSSSTSQADVGRNISSRTSFAGATSSQQAANSPPEDEFEAGLSEIAFGLSGLKEMAIKLGDEVSDHNEMLDRITSKSERAGDSIKHQNRQIQQLLKKG